MSEKMSAEELEQCLQAIRNWEDELDALINPSHRLRAHISALQREADGLRQSIAWVGEVYPATNPESGGAVVHMTWEQFNAMRECVGLKPVKGRRSPQAEADKGSDQ